MADVVGGTRGPTTRGQRRREALVQAAVELLAAEGVAAVSHRAVAGRAGVPLAATTYYFASREDLVTHAWERLRDQNLAASRAVRDLLPAGVISGQQLVDAVVGVVLGDLGDGRDGADSTRLAAFYERYLQAGRQPGLRKVVRSWNLAIVEILGDLLSRAGYPGDGVHPRLLLAVTDGLLVAALGEGESRVVARVRGELTTFLETTGWRVP